jgi:uncharacterized protein YutE (UPF0331/DUF86 family)
VVDEAIVLRKIAELDQYHRQISEYKSVKVNEYSGDWKLQRIIERTLQMMVETCVDIAGHIISDHGYRIPDSYADSFRVLHEEKIIDEKTCKTMENIAKFRNIIVHHYDRIDAEIVVGILHKHLNDFKNYKKAITTWLKSQQTQ